MSSIQDEQCKLGQQYPRGWDQPQPSQSLWDDLDDQTQAKIQLAKFGLLVTGIVWAIHLSFRLRRWLWK